MLSMIIAKKNISKDEDNYEKNDFKVIHSN